MEQVCVHCGQTFETEAGSTEETMTCPACGRPTSIPAAAVDAPDRGGIAPAVPSIGSRIRGRDIVIVAAVLA